MLNHAQPRFQNAVRFEAFKDACSGLPAQQDYRSNPKQPVLIRLLCLSGCWFQLWFSSSSIIFHIFHHVPSFSTIFHNFPSFSIFFHHVPSFSTIFHNFSSFSIIFHHFSSFSTKQFGWSHFSNGWLETTVLHSRRNLNGPRLPGNGRFGGGPQGSRRCHLGDPIFFMGEKHL